MDCIFCKIAAGEIPSNKVYEDEKCLCFYDLAPAAPVHALLIPKEHMDNVLEGDAEILGYLLTKAGEIARQLGLEEKGFRLVINTGEEGGQSVKHLHIHILGGRSLAWPPG
jgi:histidine triad (HIT) family protein